MDKLIHSTMIVVLILLGTLPLTFGQRVSDVGSKFFSPLVGNGDDSQRIHFMDCRLDDERYTIPKLSPVFATVQEVDNDPEAKSSGRIVSLDFDQSLVDGAGNLKFADSDQSTFVRGLTGQAIRVGVGGLSYLKSENKVNCFRPSSDFSLQFWVRTTADSNEKMVLLSNKPYPNNGMAAQKGKGWMFGCFNGTWAWNMGSSNRRISYDRTNGEFMPINDGRWHQLAMTHTANEGLVRLYFDGRNMVTYNVKDSSGFDFGNDAPLTIGWSGEIEMIPATELPSFKQGQSLLQELVDTFNSHGLPAVTQAEFEQLVSRPENLFVAKFNDRKEKAQSEDAELIDQLESADLEPLKSLSRRLMSNPYTVHQSKEYHQVALIFKLYRIVNGKVVIDEDVAKRLAKREALSKPKFDLDQLQIHDRVVSSAEIRSSYVEFFEPIADEQAKKVESLVAGCWNIHHGGLHESVEEDGWDSRRAIIDLFKREEVDVIMMQETYSAGDFIAAELGFYYATTVDWDYLFQGANISVISRYPIEEVFVPPKSAFMNVAAKIALSSTQEIFVMSNWYGMRNFEDVFSFHESRFSEADKTPVLFAGDFNAVPDGDGGDSLAARKLLAAGFTDAYRQFFSDPKSDAGFTHESNRRIDQMYFKGSNLKHMSTEVLSEWPSRFPSDHFLIKSVFELGIESEK